MTDFFELYDTNGKPLKHNVKGSGGYETGLFFGDALSNKIKMSLLEKPQPQLRLYGVVDEEMAGYVRKSLMFLEAETSQPPINAIITSTGGSVIAGMEILSLFSQYPGGVNGYVEGYAYSAAAQYILQGCLIRYAHRYSRLLCHYVHISTYISEFGNKLGQIRKDLKESNNQTVEILMARSGKSEIEVRKFLKGDQIKTAWDYKKFGLVDAIYNSGVLRVTDKNGALSFKQQMYIE